MIVRVLRPEGGSPPELFTYTKTEGRTTILANDLPLYSIERREDGTVQYKAWHSDTEEPSQIQDILSILNDLVEYGETVYTNERKKHHDD